MTKKNQRKFSLLMIFTMIFSTFQPFTANPVSANTVNSKDDFYVADEFEDSIYEDDSIVAIEVEEKNGEFTENNKKIITDTEKLITQEEKEPVKNKGDPVKEKEVLEETKKEKNQNKSTRSVERAGEFKDELYNLPYGSMVEIDGEIYTWTSSLRLPNDAKHIGKFETTSGEVIYLDKDKNIIKEGVLTYEGTHTLFTLCEIEIIPAFVVYEKDNKKYLIENYWREGCAPVDQLVAKTDAESGKVIEGAIFEVVDADNNVIEEVTGGVINLNKLTLTKYDGTNYDLKENEVLHSYIGSYGESYVPKEPYKEDEVYTIREKEAPEGYVKADKEFRFKVKKSTLTWEGTTYIVHDITKEDGKYFERIYFPNKKTKPNDLKIIKKKGDKNPEIEFIKEITESQQKLNQLIAHWEKQDYKEEDFQYTVIDKYGNGEQRILYFDVGAWTLHATPYQTVINAVEELIDEAKNDEDLTDKKADKIFNEIVRYWKGATECADCNRWEILDGPKPMPEFIFTPEDDNILKGELSGAKFEIKNSKGEVIHTVTTNEDGVATIKDINAGDYTIREVEAPKGYILDEQEYPITVKGDGEGVITFTAYNESIPLTPLEPAKTSVDVEKVWKGEKQESVTINLLADGKKVDSVKLSKENDWKHKFTDLPVVNDIKDEKAIEYTVEEVEVEGYKVSIDGNAKDGFVVTNLQTGTIDIPVEKKWNAENKFNIKVNLYADGKQVWVSDGGEIHLTEENNWKGRFTNLPKYNEDGEEIVYTIVESVGSDYTGIPFDAVIEGDQYEGYTITNTELVDFMICKYWEDDSDDTGSDCQTFLPMSLGLDKEIDPDRPDEITVDLLQDGKVVETVKVSKENGWTAFTAKYPLLNKDGKKHEYKFVEHDVEGYENEIEIVPTIDMDGYKAVTHLVKINNVKLPETTDIGVEKVWKGKAQESVTINLLADGKKVDSVKLSKDNGWKHTFTDLPVVNDVKDEQAIVYTVEEVEIDGYEVSIDGNAKDGFVVTNKEIIPPTPLEPAKTSVDVEKVWKGKAQESVTINLLADGKKVDSVKLSDENDWKHTFTDLPVVNDIKDEQAIVYTVEEVEIEGYEVSITGNAKDGFVITNTEINENEVIDETPSSSDEINENEVADETPSSSDEINENEVADETPSSSDEELAPIENKEELINKETEQGEPLSDTATNNINLLILGIGILFVSSLLFVFLNNGYKRRKAQ